MHVKDSPIIKKQKHARWKFLMQIIVQ
jgi:hypothetical protein